MFLLDERERQLSERCNFFVLRCCNDSGSLTALHWRDWFTVEYR